MFEIERTSWLGRRYAVRDDAGRGGEWQPRGRLSEELTGEIGGAAYELRRDGRTRFVLTRNGEELATATAAKRRWTIEAGGTRYELAQPSKGPWHMELRRGAETIGRISRGRSSRGKFVCELPAELDPALQVFVGLVAMTLWGRAVSSTGISAAGG
jgi:hypothetical protein